jgi:hypothetical protein
MALEPKDLILFTLNPATVTHPDPDESNQNHHNLPF